MEKKLRILNNKIYLWLAGGLVFLLFYYYADPWHSGWLPQCVFHKMIGLQCMGCGSQRVIHSLLHGDFPAAFRANAFLVISLPFLFFLAWVELTRNRYPGLYKRIHSLPVIITVSLLLIAWFIIRNIFGL